MRTVAFLALMGVLLGGCARDSQSEATPAKVAECTARMSLTLPPSARPIAVRIDRGMDDMISFKLEIAMGDLPAFIEQSPFRSVTLESQKKYVHSQRDTAWWDVDNVTQFQSGEIELQDSSHLQTLIDVGHPSTATIYLFWFQT